MLALDNKVWIYKLAYTQFTSLGASILNQRQREDFVSLSKANAGKTVALIGWQVSCVRTSPAKSQDKVCLMLMIEV